MIRSCVKDPYLTCPAACLLEPCLPPQMPMQVQMQMRMQMQCTLDFVVLKINLVY